MNYTKMVMVPQSDPLRNQQLDAPLLTQLSTLDGALRSILDDGTLPAELKMQKYMQMFQRYQSLKGHQLGPTMEEAHKPLERDLMETLPANTRNKGRMLLQHVNRHPEKFQ